MLRITLGVVIGFAIGLATVAIANRAVFAVVLLVIPVSVLSGMDHADQDRTLAMVGGLKDAGSCLAWLLATLVGASTANLVAARHPAAGRILSGLFTALLALMLVDSVQHSLLVEAGFFAATIAGAVTADRLFRRPRRLVDDGQLEHL